MPNGNGKRGGERKKLSIKPAEGPKQAAKAKDNLSSQPSVVQDMVKPTPEADIREVRQRVEEVFHAIGRPDLPGTIVPTGAKNNAAEAAEYVLATHLYNLASERKKKATEAAEKAGVFGDEEAYVEGSTVMVYSDPNYSINVKLGKPAKIINKGLLEAAALEILGPKKSEELLERAQKDRAPTKTIIVSMK